MNKKEVEEIIATINVSDIDELIDAINDKLKVSTALFDETSMLIGLCKKAKRCKCYYMKLCGEENQCSIFNPEFVAGVLKEVEVDKLCDYACRLTSKVVQIHDKNYTLVVFQYNLENDDLSFNPTNNPNVEPLHRYESSIKTFWQPNYFTEEARDLIFDFFVKECHRFLN